MILIDLVAAIQIAAFSVFHTGSNYVEPERGIFHGSLLILFLSSLAVSIFLSKKNIKNLTEHKISEGLFFIGLASIIYYFSDNFESAVVARTLYGIGLGIFVSSQIGIIFHLERRETIKFFLAVIAVFIIGFMAGPYIVEFLSGPSLDVSQIAALIGIVFPAVALIEIYSGFVAYLSSLILETAPALKARRERIGIIIFGQTFNATFDHIFNYWIYIPVIAILGPIKGGLILLVTDIILSFIFLSFYDWSKQDWLGIETIKELRDLGPQWIKKFGFKSKIGKLIFWPFSKLSLIALWVLKKGDVAAFFILSVFFDPFITTVYLRKNSFGKMGIKEWFIFFFSAIISNGWWTIRSLGLIYLATRMLNIIF